MEYLLSNPSGTIDVKKFEESCGVGISITPDQIEQVVEDLVAQHRAEILEKRYAFNVGQLMSAFDVLFDFLEIMSRARAALASNLYPINILQMQLERN